MIHPYCIELESFFKGLQTNGIKRYIIEKYDDYWTNILDYTPGVNKSTHHKILSFGREYFTTILQPNLESTELRNPILSL